MAENTPQEYRQLTREELESLAGGELPERAAMSLINANIAIPVNPAIAANVLSAPPGDDHGAGGNDDRARGHDDRRIDDHRGLDDDALTKGYGRSR